MGKRDYEFFSNHRCTLEPVLVGSTQTVTLDLGLPGPSDCVEVVSGDLLIEFLVRQALSNDCDFNE